MAIPPLAPRGSVPPPISEEIAGAPGAPRVREPSATAPPRIGAHGGRPLDELDDAAATSIIDLHADTPLHNEPLEGDGNPGILMQIWMGFINFLALFIPSLRNFFRHVTRETLDHEKRGLQVFSIGTEGLPPFFRVSHQAYTQVIADWPSHANDSPMNAFIYQAAWVWREAQSNPDRIQLGVDANGMPRAMTRVDEILGAIRSDHVALQIGVEGAFPLVVQDDDMEAYRAFINNPDNNLPADFPLPTEAEMATQAGRLSYMQRLGVVYMGLNHLNSSCFMGSDLATADDRHSGMTDAGRDLVRSFDSAGMLLDLAHASQQAQLDAVEMVRNGEYTLPLMVSHCVVQLPDANGNYNPDDLNWRMTRNEVLDAVRDTDGVVGIMFARVHLPDPTVHGICDQIDAVVRRIGMDHVAFGSDADGFVGLPFENLGEGYDQIIAELRTRGYDDADLAKLRGGNYLHTLRRREAIMDSRRDSQRTTARRGAEARDPSVALRPRTTSGASISPAP